MKARIIIIIETVASSQEGIALRAYMAGIYINRALLATGPPNTSSWIAREGLQSRPFRAIRHAGCARCRL